MLPTVRRLAALSLMATCLSVAPEPDASMHARAASTSVSRTSPNRRGRPRKFNRPAKAVTLTLPEDTIAMLRSIDRDISRAVVRVVEPLAEEGPRPPAELNRFGDRAVIVVTPTPALTQHTGAELVPLADGRALLAFDSQLAASQLELRLRDALSENHLDEHDRSTFASLVDILRNTRQKKADGVSHRNIVVLNT